MTVNFDSVADFLRSSSFVGDPEAVVDSSLEAQVGPP